MYKPNYQNGSIVNLMSSIKEVLGGKSRYKPLDIFDFSNISKKNIVLIVIDGLGYNYLTKYGKDSFLYKNLKGKMTSVFPATTASAMTTFSTGLAPQQHALTGWFMYLKEIGAVSVILPFTSRAGDLKLTKGKIKYKKADKIPIHLFLKISLPKKNNPAIAAKPAKTEINLPESNGS